MMLHPTYAWLGLLWTSLSGFVIYRLFLNRSRCCAHKDIPVATNTQLYLPRFLLNLQFACSATKLLEHGYQKFRSTAFQLMRSEGPIIILPQHMVTELSAVPSHIASPHTALERDLLGPLTGMDLILESRLHHSIVQRKLTPRLGLMSAALEQELNEAISQSFPTCDEWTEIQPYQLLAKISARLSARALVGPEFCKNASWLDIAVNYTESLFQTTVLVRLFPTWAHSLCCRLLPSYWNGQHYLRSAKELLLPRIQDLLDRDDSGSLSSDPTEDSNVMAWLAQTAKGGDRSADKLAHLQVLLALASVHTTLLRMVNVLFDITANPRYIEELRDEIRGQEGQWSYSSYSAMRKLDSVLRESQRLSPPTILGMKRIFKAPFTFSGGLHVPKNAYVCMSTLAIENDPSITPDPEVFDGLRSFRRRQLPGEDEKHQFSSPDEHTLAFGFGRSACPGRFFASVIVKMTLVKLLTTYDFKFLPGQKRPRNLIVHEFLFPWPWDKVLIRRRAKSECPF